MTGLQKKPDVTEGLIGLHASMKQSTYHASVGQSGGWRGPLT
jgi:hypothetical protein